MIFSLFRLFSFLLIAVNVACINVEKVCARRCRNGRGGALCRCSVAHFKGKRSGPLDLSRPFHNFYSGHLGMTDRDRTQKFGADAIGLEPHGSKYRLRDLTEVISHLSQNQDDIDEPGNKLFVAGKRQESVSPASNPNMAPQILHEFERLWKAREKLSLAEAISDRENFVASQVSSRKRNSDQQEPDGQKQDIFIQNHNIEKSEDHSSSNTGSNDNKLRSRVAETVREMMESHLQADGNSNHRAVGNHYYLQNKRNTNSNQNDKMSNDSPIIPDTSEVVATGYTRNRKSKGGLTLTQLDRLLKRAFGKGFSRLPHLGDFDDNGATS